MDSLRKNLDIIFERSLKWRLLKRAFTSAEGLKVLINSFRYYDLSNTGKISRDKWVEALSTNGLVIGISKDELGQLFDKYKEENSEYIDYKKFAFDLFFKYNNNNKISLNKIDPKNINYNNNYQKTESMINRYNNNAFLNINVSTPINQSQNILVNNNTSNSPSLFNRQINNNYNYYKNRYNFSNIKTNNNNELQNSMPLISYSGSHVNTVNNSVGYFKSKINVNNGLNYYKLIFDLQSKSYTKDQILKNDLPIALQNIGVFYTQNELQNFLYALDCSEITINTFSLSKLIKLIKDDMNYFRVNLVSNVFKTLSTNDSLSLEVLKEKFRPEMHPDVLNHKSSANDIYNNFCECLDIFSKINNISNIINLDQFIDFYSGISSSIYDDGYFSYIVKNVWSFKDNNNNENNNISKIQKSPSSPKINYNNLDIDKFNFNYNQNNNLNGNNYNRNYKDRINNNSNTKINLPLFYYNRNNNNLNNIGLSKSTNFSENVTNSGLESKRKGIYEQLSENNK